LAVAAAVGAVCASGAAQAAHVGVYVGGAVPGYYVPAPAYYYYPPAPPPPPPPQYIERGPDGQPRLAPGPDGAPPYPPDGAAPYPPNPQNGSAAYPPDGSAAYPPDDDAPPYPQGSAPASPPAGAAPAPAAGGSAPPYPQDSDTQAVTPQTGGSTWYFCDATKSYYPYVKNCTSGWRPVPAQPSQQQQQPQ